jgi:hypothetical protein
LLIATATNKYGWNLHIWDVPISDIVPSRKIAWAAQVFFMIGTTCTKISILLFYRRLTAGALPRTFLCVIYGSIAFITAYVIACLLVLLLGCRPLDAYWYSALPTYTAEYSCYNEGTAIPAVAIISVVTDIIVVSLPCYVVLGMTMPIRQKLTLIVIFGVGFMYAPPSPLFSSALPSSQLMSLLTYSTRVCIAGIVRTVYIWRTFNDTYDETWVGYTVWLWTAVEVDLAIICACTPALKPLFKRYLGGTISEKSKVSGSPGAYTRDTEAGKLTNVSGEIRLGSRKSYDKSPIVVASELSVVELSVLGRRVSESGTDDGCSAHGSSVGSSQDLNRNRVDTGR